MNAVANPLPAIHPFRRLQRWTVFFMALVAGLVAIRYGWNALVDRRIAELERRAHAMGQPLQLGDFVSESVPDADNAAVPIGQALTMYLAGSARIRLTPSFTSDEDTPIAPAVLPAISGWVKPLQPELNLIRSARGRPQMVWNRPLISPIYRQLLPQASAAYSISQIQLLAAEDAYARSDDGQMIEDVRDLLLLQKAIDCYYPVPVAHMVALGIGGRATVAVRRSLMNLQISDGPKSGATSPQVKALIADLLDESAMQKNGTRAFFGEAAMFLDAAPYEARWLRPAGAWLFEPMYKADAERKAAVNVANAQSFQKATWPAVHAGLESELAPDASLLESITHPIFRGISYDPNQWPKLHFHHLAERRIAAVMLALRLYQHDHSGALPRSLTELVPQYLPSVPADPFDPSNRALRYLPLHDPPILYSVGENGADDGGSEKLMPGQRLRTSDLTVNRWLEKDAVFSLKPVPRLLQAQDHQGQVSGGKGQKSEK